MDLETGTGVLTIAKFHTNRDSDSRNKVVTRTLGKFGVLHKFYEGIQPKEDEFWICRIIDNVRPNDRQGCFVLEPVKKVDYTTEVGKLMKGMYDEIVPENNKQLIYVKPKEKFKNHVWQLSLDDRKQFNGRHVIVMLDESLINNNIPKIEESNGKENQ